jgi:hypothetical protein
VADTDPAVLLAMFRDRAEDLTDHDDERCADPQKSCTGHDALRMADALDAILKQHQPGRIVLFGSLCERHESHRYFSITATEAADVQACPDCSATVCNSCTGCGPSVSIDSCPARNAITSALTGEVTS